MMPDVPNPVSELRQRAREAMREIAAAAALTLAALLFLGLALHSMPGEPRVGAPLAAADRLPGDGQ